MNNQIHQQVLQASQQWIDQFNQGQLDNCINTYTPDAVLDVRPQGRHLGRTEIGAFWRNFATLNPGNLCYRNRRVYPVSETEAILSASWTMNVASGFITKELWRTQPDGSWLLAEDDFTVVTIDSEASDTRVNSQSSAQAPVTALLIVDLQNDYFPGGKMPLHNTDAAAANAEKVLQHFRASGQPIIHIRHVFPSKEAPFFAIKTPGAEIHDSVKPLSNELVVTKSTVNSFSNTELENLLIKHRVENLVIVGAMTHMCVDAVTRAASDMGYACTVLHDATTSTDLRWNNIDIEAKQVIAAFMCAFEFAYALVSDTDTWLKSHA